MLFFRFLFGILLVSRIVLALDVEYKTFIGGMGRETPASVWGDASGRALVAGETSSENLPTTPTAFQPRCGGQIGCGAPGRTDAFVGRLSSDGSRFEFLTYLGGESDETVSAVRGDALGSTVVVGTTESADFPFSGALFGPAEADRNGFVVKLTPSGSRLAFALPLPGFTPLDAGFDSLGNLWILGSGDQPLPTTENAPQREPQTKSTPYLAAIDPSGARLLFATYWGGNRSETAGALAVDASGDATICGLTTSANFPTTEGALKSRDVLPDVFAARFGLDGRVFYSTRFGGSDTETLGRCVVDAFGRTHVVGTTRSLNFPWTTEAPETSARPSFYARISADGSRAEQVSHIPSVPVALAAGPSGGVFFLGGGTGIAPRRVEKLDALGEIELLTIVRNQGVFSNSPDAFDGDAQGNLFLLQRINESNPDIGRRPEEIATPGAAQTVPAGAVNLLLTKFSMRPVRLQVEPRSLSFQQLFQQSRTFELSVSAAAPSQGSVPFSVRTEDAWVTISSPNPIAGPELLAQRVVVRVTAEPPSAAPGVYESAVILEARGVPAVRIPVRYEITPTPVPYLRPLIAEHVIGTPESAAYVGSFNLGSGIRYETSAPWVRVELADPIGNRHFVRLDPVGLAPGVHRATITARDENGAVVAVVPLTLYLRSPRMTVLPGSVYMRINGSTNRSATAEVLIDIPRSSAQEELQLASAVSNATWLTATPLDAIIPGRVVLTASADGLAPGRYAAEVSIRAVESIPTLRVPVVLDLDAPARLSVNPSSIAYLVPSPEMLVGSRELHIDSDEPRVFRIEPRFGLNLKVAPLEGVTPAVVQVSIESRRFETSGAAEIRIHAGDAIVTVPVVLGKRWLSPSISAFVNAASFKEGYVSPGSLASVFGQQLAFALWSPNSLPIQPPNSEVGVSVTGLGGDQPTPPVFISPGQINIQIPNFTPGGATLDLRGVNVSERLPIEILESSPGIFTFGRNRAVVQNRDGSVNTATNGAAPGEIGVLYLTGQGPLDREIQPGNAAPSLAPARATLPVELTVGGRRTEVLFAGLAPGFVGLCQVNFRFPDLPPGDYPVRIQFGGQQSNEAIVSIR